jgi:hypothetical protein
MMLRNHLQNTTGRLEYIRAHPAAVKFSPVLRVPKRSAALLLTVAAAGNGSVQEVSFGTYVTPAAVEMQ